MASIQSPGIGSGLDVNSIVSQLMAIERQPLLRLAQQEAEYHAEISAFGTLKSAVSTLQEAVATLKDSATFQGTVAQVSDESVLTASTDSTAVPGRFDVTVNRLAQHHKLASAELDSTDTFGGKAGDELNLTVDATSFTLDLSTAKSLTEIRDAINGTANETGVTANIITGDNGKQTLVLTSGDSGYDNRIQLAYGGSIKAKTFDFATINKDADGDIISSDTELDASVTVDGVSLTRAGNSISDVVEGVTLELKGQGSSEVSVSRDAASVNQAVEDYVSAHNALRSQLSTLSAGELSGDSVLLGIESRIRNILNTPISGSGSFSFLQEIGVTTNDNGDLELDGSVLDAAMEQDLDGVTALFTTADNGFAVRLDSLLEGFISSQGLIDTRIDGLNNRIDGILDRRDTLERRLEQTESRLRAQFTALDELVGQLQATSNFLTQQLAGLPSSFSDSK